MVVTFNSSGDIASCLESLAIALRESSAARIVVVDNHSSDDTAAIVRSRFPAVELLLLEENLGFAAGNNAAIRRALAAGADFVYLLNPDATVDASFLDRALAEAGRAETVAAVQSLLLLAPDGERIDSAGNALHFLGFGYCQLHGKPRAAAPLAPCEIPFASGAGVLLRASALRAVGLFDDSLFLYCEDLDLGWRLRRAGYSIVLAPGSIVFHRHEFERHPDKYYLLERNRWRVLLANWSARSLAVLALPLLVNELALLAIAWKEGWLRAKLRATASLFSRPTWNHLRSRRIEARRTRRIGDRQLAVQFTSRMEVAGTEPPFLARVANPVLSLLWRMLRRLL